MDPFSDSIPLSYCSPGVDFINILRTAFTLVDPKSVKKIDNLTVFFTLLGSACQKAVRRTLMKLRPGVDFINVLLQAFKHVDPKSAKKTDGLTVFFELLGSVCVKAASKMLAKSTIDYLVNKTNLL